ncbi:efflux RND transporter periplasmic adaptor subunit [Bauldia sp.]|uniref:efflux RND transporter periplasmic adaptor subunit n=1 Tax=Bauldia sp. TaxID=2575872 RepID=UPI003BAD3A5D
MSIGKQLGVALAIMLIALGAWVIYDRPVALFGATEEVSDGGRPGGGFAGFGAAPTVVAAPVEIDSAGTSVRAIGTAVAAREVALQSQVTGIVVEVNFVPGGEVEAGEVLVHLEDDDERVAVDLAALAVESAQETLERTERLSETGSVTAVTLSEARREEQRAAIDLRRAEIELAKRSIMAPFDGVIGLSSISTGDLVTSSTTIATLADLSSITVSFDVPERVARDIALGQAVTATAPALPGETIVGELTAIDNRIDATTRTLRVEATLPNPGEDLRPGMAVNIGLAVDSEPQPAVPSLAIQWDRDGSFVWKLEGDAVTRVPVQVIVRRSGAVTVAGDLTADDRIIVEGVLGLREGQTVSPIGGVVPPAAEPEAQAPDAVSDRDGTEGRGQRG